MNATRFVVSVLGLVLLAVCGCSPARNFTFQTVDSHTGNPIPDVHADKYVPRASLPWSLLLWPGGIGPDCEERVTDAGGEVSFDNSKGGWYRLRAEGYKDVEIEQTWFRLHSPTRRKNGNSPDGGGDLYTVPMQRVQPLFHQ